MICRKCGKEIPEESLFCLYCGRKQANNPPRNRKRPQGFGTIHKDIRNHRKPWIAHAPTKKSGERKYLGAFATYQEAQDSINDYLRNDRPELHGATLADIYKLWSESHFRRVSESTARLYASMWKHFQEIQSLPVEEIRPAHFQAIVDRAASRSSAEAIRTLTGLICRFAMQNDVIREDYSRLISIPASEQQEKPLFSPQQIADLWEHSDDRNVQIVLFMIYTGLRIRELACLLTENVHLEEGYLICGEAGKDRMVPLPSGVPEIRQFLALWMQNGSERVLNASASKIRKGFYSVLYDLHMIKAEKGKNGWLVFPDGQHLTPCSTRNTFASLCVSAGVKPGQLRKILGKTKCTATADLARLCSEMGKLRK